MTPAAMRAVWLRRGPWGIIPRHVPRQAALVVKSLAELCDRVYHLHDGSVIARS